MNTSTLMENEVEISWGIENNFDFVSFINSSRQYYILHSDPGHVVNRQNHAKSDSRMRGILVLAGLVTFDPPGTFGPRCILNWQPCNSSYYNYTIDHCTEKYVKSMWHRKQRWSISQRGKQWLRCENRLLKKNIMLYNGQMHSLQSVAIIRNTHLTFGEHHFTSYSTVVKFISQMVKLEGHLLPL